MPVQVAVRAPNHLGDCVMALPMLSDVREAIPDALVTVLVPESLQELLLSCPGIDRIVPIPNRYCHGLAGVMHIRDLLSRERYEYGFILPPSFGAASSFALAKIPNRIGYVSDGRRLLLSKALALPEPVSSEHRSKLYYDLLRRGVGADFAHRPPRLPITEAVTATGRELLGRFFPDGWSRLAVIGFRAVAESRRWGGDHYARVCSWLVEQGWSVALIGTADAVAAAGLIATAVNSPHLCSLTGKTSITELIAVCSVAGLFVGDESGAAHVAAAVGLPVVIPSGAAEPAETAPLALRRAIVRVESLDCLGCVKNVCPLRSDRFMRCMRDLEPETVIEAIRRIGSDDQT